MFSGLMPAIVTPFDEDGRIDAGAGQAVVDRLIGAGVSGLVALGSTGEFSHLESAERRWLAEEVRGWVGGRIPLIVGVGATGTGETISQARHAEELGADAALEGV